MGYEAPCTLRVGGEVAKGKAVLEQHDLIFRGPTRLAIPLKTIASAIAHEGSLIVRFGKTTAVFDIGGVAGRWANRITNPPSRLDKLGVKPGMTVVIAGERHDDLVHEIESRGGRVVKTAPAEGSDLVFYGASRRDMLNRLRALKRSLKPNGALWVIRPKGSAAISESEVMTAGKSAGLVDVKVVSFSDTHTAEKFVIPTRDRSAG
jgi:DUF3052 family protein